MPIIEKPANPSDAPLERVSIEVDRHSLQKCRWRRTADDGVDFAFSLEEPLANGDVILETATARYQISQLPEPVFVIPIPAAPRDAARLGWLLGNLHQPVEIREDGLLVADAPAVRRVLGEIAAPFEEQFEIFTPPPHSAAHGHEHLPGLEYDHEHRFFGHRHAPSL